MGTVISLGSINMDFQMRVDQPVGRVETQLASDFTRCGGGKAANTAWLAKRFGHESRLLGLVGDDRFADEVLAPLKNIGVDTGGVRRAANRSTAVSMIFVPPEGKKNIVLASNANDAWTGDDIEVAVQAIDAAPADALLVADCEIGVDACRAVLAAAQRRGLRIVLDAAPPDRALKLRDLWPGITAFSPNDEEASVLTSIDIKTHQDALHAARVLRDHGIALVCIKRSDGGCVVDWADGTLAVKVAPVEVVDSTGAGDAFTGVLASALADGIDPAEAARLATAAANLAVTKWGSQPAYAERAEVERFAATLEIEWLDAR